MKKKTVGIISVIVVPLLFIVLSLNLSATTSNTTSQVDKQVLNSSNSTSYNLPDQTNTTLYELHQGDFQISVTNDTIKVTIPQEFKQEIATIPIDKLLFYIVYQYGSNHQQVKSVGIGLKPNLIDLYYKIGFSSPSNKIVYVYPIFTQSAYSAGGFYDYYAGNCDTRCLTVSISNNSSHGSFVASAKVATELSLLNYSRITDIDIDRNPDILKKYDKVILLHNEYVTKKEFDAITSHPNVLYLFADALHAEVKPDYDKNTITLIRGHGYPQPEIVNGFDWKYDNSKYEYDIQCDNWTIQEIPNGKMVNCYPAYRSYYDQSLWNLIRN